MMIYLAEKMQYRDLIQQANLLREQDNLESLEKAIEFYRQAIELNPKAVWAFHHLGIALEKRGLFDQAIEAFRNAINRCSGSQNSYRFHCQLGSALRQQNQWDEAVAVYQQAVVLKPAHPETYSTIANLFAERQHLDQAIFWQRQAVKCAPNNLRLQHSLLLWTTQQQDQILLALLDLPWNRPDLVIRMK